VHSIRLLVVFGLHLTQHSWSLKAI